MSPVAGKSWQQTETWPDGKVRAKWSGKTDAGGRSVLDGAETWYAENGATLYSAAWRDGKKTGAETWWSASGRKIWEWEYGPDGTATWTQFWPNGRKKVESTWNTKPEARDLKRSFFGLVADGPVKQWNEDGSLKSSGNFSNGLLLKEAVK